MKIIVATDFSPNALDAARSATRLARKLGDSMLLLRVIDPPTTAYPELGVVAPEIVASLREASERELAKLTAALSEEGVLIEKKVLVGAPAQMIAKAAEEEGARLVVMGTHGRSAASRLFWGSVAERTVLRAKCPVLVLREGAAPFDEWVRGTRPLRIVVGVDCGPATQAALAWIRELRKAGRCAVTMVHEYWPPAEYARLGLRPAPDLLKTDPEVVSVLERELRASGVHLEGDGESRLLIQAAWGRTVDSLAMSAEAEHADVLVVGTRQLHGWERVKAGAVTLGTLRASHVPVFCVPLASLPRSVRQDTEEPVLGSILAATDLSELGNGAVTHAYGLLKGRGGTVELCTVVERHVPSPAFAYDDKEEPISPERQAHLEAALRALVPPEAEGQGIRTRIHVINRGLAAHGILQAAERLGVDAIVLGSQGRTGLGRALMGSVAESVMRGAEKPVYVVRKPS